jgi:hypothetical protein
MSTSLKITYDLKPPADVEPTGLTKSITHNFTVQSFPEDGQKKYYNALQESITKAKEQIGNELTAWRDAVGKAELTKEPKQVKEEEEEEEEDE